MWTSSGREEDRETSLRDFVDYMSETDLDTYRKNASYQYPTTPTTWLHTRDCVDIQGKKKHSITDYFDYSLEAVVDI